MPGELIPSEAAQAYRKQFVEVLLDEYQDTNRVQEAIVELISNIKAWQSVYGWRRETKYISVSTGRARSILRKIQSVSFQQRCSRQIVN